MHSTYKTVCKELICLSLPMALTQFITIGSIFIAMVMVSHLGHDVLAASALIYSARISIIVISGSILFSLSILVGRAYGEQNHLRIGTYLQQGWLLALLLSVPVMLIYWNIHTIMLFFGQETKLAEIVKTFFHANILNGLPFLLAICNQQLLYGVRKQRIDLIANIFAATILVMLSYVLIFGHLGLPKLGVRGLAYALTFQAWFYFLLTSTIIIKTEFFKKFELFRFRLRQNFHDFKQMLTVGWPICVQISGELLSLFALAAMVGWLSTKELAAYQVINQYFFLIIVPLFAIAQASGVVVGQSYGARQFKQIRFIGDFSVFMTCIITISTLIIFTTMPHVLTSFYIDIHNPQNANMLNLIAKLFILIGFYNVFDGIRNVTTGGLRGLLDTKCPMYVGLSVIWFIEIPLAYILGFYFNYRVAGIIFAGIVAMLIGASLVSIRWRSKNTLIFNMQKDVT